jgi:hypothetical protein
VKIVRQICVLFRDKPIAKPKQKRGKNNFLEKAEIGVGWRKH